ncbi:MAG: hypothetical protein OHK0022_14590 [Roseiflexaceae bacterium]
MQREFDRFSSGPARPARRRRPRPVRTGVAALLLAFGAMLTRLALVANGLAHRWAGDTTVRAWVRAIRAFRATQGKTRQLPEWEQALLRVGPPVLLAIGSALTLLWVLVLVGGGLAWLVVRGYGFPLMLATVLAGVLIGCWRASLAARLPDQDGLN